MHPPPFVPTTARPRFCLLARASNGKADDEAALENASAFASGVSNFPTAPATTAAGEIGKLYRTIS